MLKVLLAKKVGMTRIYDGDRAIPVTVVESPDCVLVKKRMINGASSVQIGFDENEKLNKPQRGQFEAVGVKPRRVLKEFIVSENSPLLELDEGTDIKPDIFEEGELVDVSGKTKGRGFQGVMKRWNFSGGPASHGGRFGRRTGSIGNAADPSRVYPNKKMPGQYGNDNQTVENLKVMRIVAEENIILIAGSVPGASDGLLIIRNARKGEENGS
ncbi:MAG: 50S ribosomal protein L3 [bacterium]